MLVVLREMIQSPNVTQELMTMNTQEIDQLPPETVKMAALVAAVLPILAIYPFLQRFFIKTMLLGSIKG